jgi:hypothetical protein
MKSETKKITVTDLHEASEELISNIKADSKAEAIRRINDADFYLIISGKEQDEGRACRLTITSHVFAHQILAVLDTLPTAQKSLLEILMAGASLRANKDGD